MTSVATASGLGKSTYLKSFSPTIPFQLPYHCLRLSQYQTPWYPPGSFYPNTSSLQCHYPFFDQSLKSPYSQTSRVHQQGQQQHRHHQESYSHHIHDNVKDIQRSSSYNASYGGIGNSNRPHWYGGKSSRGDTRWFLISDFLFRCYVH